MIVFGSLVSSRILSNAFIAKIVGALNNYYATNLSQYLTVPVLNYFIYNYLSGKFYTNEYLGTHKNHTSSEMMYLPVV